MSFAKSIAFAAALAFTLPAHAGSNAQGPHGGIAAARGIAASRAANAAAMAAHQAAMATGTGTGRSMWAPDMHSSMVDAYQPFPESEMRQFQKPHWEPYRGD